MQHSKARVGFLFLLLLSGLVGFCQDLIVQHNGNRIYCRIVAEDSLKIYYLRPPQKRQFEINKSEVYRLEQSSRKKVINTQTNTSSSGGEFTEVVLLNFSAGIANPLSDFASMDPSSEKSGLAKTGYVFQAATTVKLTDYFGINLLYRYQRHKFAHELIAQLLSSQYGAPFTSTSSDWLIKGVFGGLHFSSPVKKISHLSVELDANAGLPKVFLPELIVSVNSGNLRATVTQHSSTTRAATFLGSVGFKYRVDENLALGITAGYLRSKAEFSNILTKSTNGSYSYDNYTQKITTFNLQFGLSFLIFGKKAGK